MSKKIKRILAIVLCFAVALSCLIVPASAATSSNVVSISPSPEVDILHMDRTVKVTASDGSSKNGFDVTLTAYLDELSKITTPFDIMYVLDSSNSMSNDGWSFGNGEREQVVASVKEITNLLMSTTNANHRYGLVSFSGGMEGAKNPIVEEATLDNMYTKEQLNDGNNELYNALDDYCWNVIGEDVGTLIDKGLERANSILDKVREPNRKQLLILFTDGAPTGTTLFDYMLVKEYSMNNALKQASALKKDGVTIFTVQTFYDWAMTESNKEKTDKLCRYMSSAYSSNATVVTNTYTNERSEEGYISEANDISSLKNSIVDSLYTTAIYPFVLDKTAIIQDVVTPYFIPSNAKCIIQKANYSNGVITSWSNASDYNSITAKIDGQRVYATGFDFINRAVSVTSSNPSRLVITYHIDPIENFLGGNSIPTSYPGTRDTEDHLKGGSGIYCKGPDNDFLKPFEDIPVNVTIPDRVVTASSAVVDYGTSVYLHNYYSVPDLENSQNNMYDGVNNAFVNATATVRYNIDSTGSTGTLSAYAGAPDDYPETKISFKNSHNVTSTIGDSFTITYTITPVTASPSSVSTVGNKATEKTFTASGVVKTDVSYAAEFKFTGEYPSEVSSLIPNSKTGLTKTQAENLKNSAPAAGYKYSTDSADYYFSGWTLSSISDVINGVATYSYTGSWTKVDTGTIFTVNMYIMDENGNYPSTPESMIISDVNIGDDVVVYREIAYDEDKYVFSQSISGEPKLVNNESYKSWHAYGANYYGYVDEDSYMYQIGNNTYYGNTKDDFYQLFEKYYVELGNGEKIYLPISTASCYLCRYCGELLIDYNYSSSGRYSCDNCMDAHVYSCDCELNPETGLIDCDYAPHDYSGYIYDEPIYYADYSLNTEKTTNSYITLSSDPSQNKIDIYMDRVPHTISLKAEYDDGTLAKTFEITDYHGSSLMNNSIYSTDEEQFLSYVNFAYADDAWSVPVEDSPYYKVKTLKLPQIYTETENGTKQLYFDNLYGMYTVDIFESSYLYDDLMPTYDVRSTITLDRYVYDLVVTKTWDTSVSQKDVQSCIFGLYEIDDLNNYNLITKFTIGVDEFKWSGPSANNQALTATKTIKGLIAGKRYALEEEGWSYKTESDFARGTTEIMGYTDQTVFETCINRNNENWVYVPTVEKGIRNYSVRTTNTVYAEPIKKNVVGGRK